MLTCWDQFEEIFWFTTCFNFKKGAESPEPSSEFQRLKSQFFIQFSLRCSFYCTSYSKGSIVLYMFNFGTKLLLLGWSKMMPQQSRCGLMKDLQIVKRDFLGRVFIRKSFYDSNPFICFQNFCINIIMKI